MHQYSIPSCLSRAHAGPMYSAFGRLPAYLHACKVASILASRLPQHTLQVQRTRVKWKVHLKDGVMRINGRDHLFHTAVGDMLF